MRPQLTNHRGTLLSGELHRGTAVHAASFIRQRSIVLESALLGNQQLLRLIYAHECFHFVWPRLGNKVRNDFTGLLRNELTARARGELGESAFVHKLSLLKAWSEKRWRAYVCEAFCDTGAYLYSDVAQGKDFTLAACWAAKREAWFKRAIHWGVRLF